MPVKVRFLQDYTVQAVGGASYRAGSVYELREDAAQHFIRRRRAVLCGDDDVPASKPEIRREQPPARQDDDRTVTSDVDLHDLFARARAEEGAEQAGLSRLPDNPLVSCIMPTRNRGAFIWAAIESFLAQDYDHRELVIVDDGDESVRKLIPRKKNIRYYRLGERMSLGVKRNRCVELARGDVICHWDDDDYSTPDRISDQLARLRESGLPMTGYTTLYLWDVVREQARLFVGSPADYVCGTTLMYLKSWWEQHPFEDVNVGEDNAFVFPHLNLVAGSYDGNHMVARIHDANVSPKDNLGQPVERKRLPLPFWDNEKRRLQQCSQS